MKTPGKPLNELIDLTVEDQAFLRGRHNWIIRMYFYLENGLNILNEFRNWFLGLAALYVALKLDVNAHGLIVLAAIALPSLIILIIAGRYNVHTLNKMKDWLSMRFSTHYGIKSFNYQEEQTELLREIRDMLKRQDRPTAVRVCHCCQFEEKNGHSQECIYYRPAEIPRREMESILK